MSGFRNTRAARKGRRRPTDARERTDRWTPNHAPFSPGQDRLGAPLTRGRLPADLTSFIGRDEDMARLATLLRHPAARLVTLVGPGGVGKTRLAVQVARRLHGFFRDGIWWVSLASLA